jgi:RimJ/RimL family protein N-acetyltransferase
VELVGSRLVLRPWRDGDQASLQKNANNPNVARNLGAFFPNPYTLEHALDWVRKHRDGPESDRDFAICVDGEAVGGIGCHPGNGIYACRATIGYWLGEEYWGRGIATEALQLLTQHAFARLDLARLEATVFEWNTASCRVLEKVGYEREALLRKSAVKDGQVIDTYLYSRLSL